MGPLRVFVLPEDAACEDAVRILRELCDGEPRYSGIKVEVIDEKRHESFSDGYDYIFVPAFFVQESVDGSDGRCVTRWVKMHEGKASAENIRDVLESVLKNMT